MEKILIIDDNKMLTKLLAKKISSALHFEVDTAFSFTEAIGLFEQGNRYFLCFADLCLPDANDGEIVDYVLEIGLPTIVLTASNDAQTREKFMDKDILAYIYKESKTCIEQIINSIDLLNKNRKSKVIIALSKVAERNELKKIFNLRLFNVLVAAHGEEALNYLNDNADTKLIIADAQMPVMNGLDLLIEIREKYSKTELGMIIVGEKNDALEASLLRNNVNEFIAKPFSKELFNARLDKLLKYMNDFELISTFTDIEPLTGAKNSVALKSELEDYLREIQGSDEEFAFAYLDIDNLNFINEEYGFDIGNAVLKSAVKEALNETMGKDIVGHFSTEKICILLKNISSEKAIKVFSSIRVNIKNKSILVSFDELFFTASIGITFGKAGANLNELSLKANKALQSAKDSGKDRAEVCF
ncbi:bile resistance response regulator CbrR [Campylobacter sp. MIT 97-5078]|uniref:bile resistance response regulator CbrR n=1 Tax=Campylobacter sp. MIT 97-5078 TaxID=1548153 RepID=UPI0005138042|nr:response regulator [Campylobacter sp. MIT 97-5078]KGI57081.1 diguanylate cyclase [Campylobacter sp. MIT 97-5078]TQR28095.1 diguanylate cyclase response regulator [Campylobacter sp. MIT 97-5078]